MNVLVSELRAVSVHAVANEVHQTLKPEVDSLRKLILDESTGQPKRPEWPYWPFGNGGHG